MIKNNSNKTLSDAWHAQQKGNYDTAISKYKNHLQTDPYNSYAITNLCVIYINLGKLDLAENLIMTYLEKTEGDIASFNHLAIVYMRTGRHIQAARLLDHALSLDPFNLETHLNLVNVYSVLKDNSKAMHYALECIKLEPTSSKAFNNLGGILNSMAMFDEAQIAFQTAYELDNSNLEALINMGTIQIMKYQNDEAIVVYEKALRKISKKSDTHGDVIKFLLSFEYLKKGQLSKGYEYYDCGFHPNIPRNSARGPARKFKKPRWDGKQINGKTILIWREQGLGDELMFLSCMPDLIAAHDKIILEVDQRLVDTMQRSFPSVEVRGEVFIPAPFLDAVYQDYDYHLPVGSLMRFFRPQIEDFNRSGPYVVINKEKKEKFTERLAPYKDKLLIGICWRSGNIDALRAMTYIGILNWGDLFSMKNVVWINLQYGECEEECLEAEKEFGIEIIRWNDLNLKDDLDDVFALITELDYVVTVATAVQHMAAAVGVETLLIKPPGDWNHFNLDYDPWFPSLHPFIAEYQNLAKALPAVKEHILAKCKLY